MQFSFQTNTKNNNFEWWDVFLQVISCSDVTQTENDNDNKADDDHGGDNDDDDDENQGKIFFGKCSVSWGPGVQSTEPDAATVDAAADADANVADFHAVFFHICNFDICHETKTQNKNTNPNTAVTDASNLYLPDVIQLQP